MTTAPTSPSADSPSRLLGYAGLLPFAGAAALAVLGPPSWRGPALAALSAYGAVILSFLGAVHWGFALRAPAGEEPAAWPRLGLGVVPALVAWTALLLPTGPGLALLAAGVVAVAAVETAATKRGLMPAGYLSLRWALSLGAGACLGLGALAAAGAAG
ncbi:MAG: DUF3429 domain-containing protein [Acetobacteraceae bacterium]|nr:DUF3429 domain-containing protein [Acetobacteraceae bacterium]